MLRITLGNSAGVKVFAERVSTLSSSTIKVTTSEGHAVTAAEFKTWFHSLAVNPHKLLEQKPREQVTTLLDALGLGEKLKQIDEEIETEKVSRLSFFRQIELQSKALGEEPPLAEKNRRRIVDCDA